MTKAQLIEKVEELSTSLDLNICRNNELGAKVFYALKYSHIRQKPHGN